MCLAEATVGHIYWSTDLQCRFNKETRPFAKDDPNNCPLSTAAMLSITTVVGVVSCQITITPVIGPNWLCSYFMIQQSMSTQTYRNDPHLLKSMDNLSSNILLAFEINCKSTEWINFLLMNHWYTLALIQSLIINGVSFFPPFLFTPKYNVSVSV